MKPTRALTLATLLSMAFYRPAIALEWEGLELRGRTELAWRYTPLRDNTTFNPGRSIVDRPEHSGILGQRLSPSYHYGPLSLRGDFWLQSEINEDDHDEEFYIQEGQLDWYVNDNLIFSGGVGLQHWGPGYIWNPANPFQDREINVEDRVISYKRNGNVFAALEWIDDSGWSATAYYVRHKLRDPFYGDNVPYENAFAIKFNQQFNNSDLTLTYARQEKMDFFGSSFSITVGNQLELHSELSVRNRRFTQLAQRVAVSPVDDIFVLQRNETHDWHAQFLMGGQYTTESQINFIFEYFYNGEGYSNSEYDTLEQGAKHSSQQLASPFSAAAAGFLGNTNSMLGRMKQHYLFARISDTQLADDMEGKLFFRYGLQDASIVVGGLLSYDIVDGISLSAGGQYFGQVSGSETAEIPFRFILNAGITILF